MSTAILERNIGISPRRPSSPAALFETVKDFRNEGAISYYARIFGLDQKTANEHFVEMLKFLCLACFHADNITPSDQLDEMWHAMIIQTKDYRQLSRRLGIFVHHATTGSPQRTAYLNAIELYKAEFGEPYPVWLEPKRKHADDSKYVHSNPDCKECEVYGWCSCSS
ncbi:MAG: hypothetical protein A3A98_01170 [Candidatus Staskawiczbacteria bacterium RIFCSPLOWO2_01_FULL_40_39]|uniref:Uncharacterized protein n=1 Tax=Candidatus Staskawiczbacteria bacterium RIFCSPHIGHO2_01_FULL_39_25 TaxID=1802202 RepID=A0A1G2HNL6_9BACT|nr:MAG: hypothetical protein A2730_01170 [Candidatus Staskawiczbacteria bacterium RIFCSPHIGHO2_01_FULL_39_25]OGZ73338.1 MAG: hypothetical protein A3A98_01170 [Candidatus Staskawiczbacteria bacterium RIFCSPLOWO2_01_FULL_40_39]OGZ76852.1 MAG: hypothetical protein A3I87_01905 [Candidatus Staskawiczbacteria bacterium RIFCSPLOWO2_02_FULL_39_8]